MSDLEQDDLPTAWKSMDSAPKDGRWLLVRYRTDTGEVLMLVVRYKVRHGWSDGEWYYKSRELLAWTDIPS